MPPILLRLDSAQGMKYLRCLREQALNAGRIILEASSRIAAKTLKKLGGEPTKGKLSGKSSFSGGSK